MNKQILTRAHLSILALSACVGFTAPCGSTARAQALVGPEQYQELFVSAGYSALFGAALGAAILPFVPSNSLSNLRIISGGASLGFVAGSVMALYNMRQRQSYVMQYYPEAPSAGPEASGWQWDLGTTDGSDLFVKMDSRF